MDGSIEQLIRILQQTEGLYTQLLPVIEQEKTAATGSDVRRLTSAGAEKQNIVFQIKSLDQQLVRSMQNMAKVFHIPLRRLNLATLAEVVRPPHDRQLQELNSRLTVLLGKVQTANEECRILIRHCLRLVQNALGFFRHWMGTSDVYGASGNIRNDTDGGRFLSGSV